MAPPERHPLSIPARERLFREIADRIGSEHVTELHVFSPLKQGAIESGVAVIAARRPVLEAAPSAAESEEPPDEPQADGASEPDRHAVYTAHYRLTLKGQERGKWEFDLRDEGDAPLETIVRVVRGVQERAGDTDDPERIEGSRFRDDVPPLPA